MQKQNEQTKVKSNSWHHRHDLRQLYDNDIHTYLIYLLHAVRVLLEKLTGLQLVKKSPTFGGTRRFVTAFIIARHLSLSWARLIQSMPPHPTSWRSILILSSQLCLVIPSGLFPSGFSTKTLYTPLLCPIPARCSPIAFFSTRLPG